MKLGLSARLALVIAMTGVLSAGLTGYYGYAASRQLLVNAAEQRLLTATRVLSRQLAVGLDAIASDVRLLSEHPAALKLVLRSDPQLKEENTALLFERLLATHPEYLQVRMIDAAGHGLEHIRVDRAEHGLLRVSGAELQEKGHYPYVFETLRLPRGSVYVSRATINHEVGAHAGQDKPSLQMAGPIVDAQGAARGLIVINVDLEGLFAQLAADLPSGLQLYLANDEGDYLIHPDRRLAFAFDHGQRELVQEHFPAVADLLGVAAAHGQERVTSALPGGQAALVAAFVRTAPTGLQAEEGLIIGLAQPLEAVLADSRRLGGDSLRIVIGFSLLSLLAGGLLARALTRPLNQIVDALRGFAAGATTDALPCERSDEIGLVARSVQDMQTQIRQQFETLQHKQLELDRLASHDSLTGLLNRRVFMDRLEHALAHARRSHGRLALLFIDLDDFKSINDSLGHPAGDAVLQSLAQRLQHLVRAADTVARVGGDEFIVLLDKIEDEAAIHTVADKLLEALAEPVPFGPHQLRSGASIGVARYPADGIEAHALIAAADKSMYRAKTGGRHRVMFTERP